MTYDSHLIKSLEDMDTQEFNVSYNRAEVGILYPKPRPSEVDKLFDEVREKTADYLIKKDIGDIIGTLSEVSKRWSNENYEIRKEAMDKLPEITGYSPETVQIALDYFSELYTEDNLKKTITTELGEEFLGKWSYKSPYGGKVKAYGPKNPRVTTNIFAGNVPGIPSLDIVRALLTKQGSVSKVSSQEPLFPRLFLKSIEEVDGELASTIAMVYWDRNSETVSYAFKNTDNVVAYGSIDAIKNISKEAENAKKDNPDLRFIPHGHKISAMGIGRDYLDSEDMEKISKKAATDVSIWDQQGCLSPHAIFVEEGGKYSPGEFAEELSYKMDEMSKELPLCELSIEDKGSLREVLDEYQFKESMGDAKIYSPDNGLGWMVIYEKKPNLEPSCLFRTIKVMPVKDLTEINDAVGISEEYLQAFGLGVGEERTEKISDIRIRIGFDRITELGEMGFPKPGSSHDSRYGLRDIIRNGDWGIACIEKS